MYGSTRKHNGDVGNPEKVLQNGMDRNGGGGKSVRTRENPNTKRKERIRRRSENSKKVGYRSKWKGGRKKRGYWTRAMAWLQQLAPDVTMKLLLLVLKIYQNIYRFTRAA